MKKIFALILTLIISLSLAACGNPSSPVTTEAPATQETTAATTQETAVETTTAQTTTTEAPPAGKGEIVDGFYKYHDKVTISAMAKYDTSTNPSELWLYKWALDKMNIEFVVQGLHRDAIAERTPLLMASNDYPEVFFAWDFSHDEASLYGDSEKQLIPIEGYINAEVMPNLTRCNDEEPYPLEMCRTITGEIYGFPNFANGNSANYEPWWCKPSTYTAVGFEKQPETLDELLDFLRKVKELDPMGAGENNIPLGGSSQRHRPAATILNAFGFTTNGPQASLIAVHGGDYRTKDIIFMPAHPAYFEYFKYMNTLYAEKLIDLDFFTVDAAVTYANFSEGYNAIITSWDPDMREDTLEWLCMQPFGSEYNPDRTIAGNGFGSMAGYAFITEKASPDKAEAICRFIDVGYDHPSAFKNTPPDQQGKGYLLSRGPQQGVDDGYGIVVGWVWDDDNVSTTGWLDSSGPAMPEAYRGEITPFYQGSSFDNRTDHSELALYSYDTADGKYVLSQEENRSPFTNWIKYPGGMFEVSDATKIQDLESVLYDYVVAESAKFITGARPLSQEEFDKYCADLKAMGMDDYMEIQLKAFNDQFR